MYTIQAGSLSNFANVCEILEFQTPNEKAKTISDNLSTFKSKPLVMQVFSLSYPTNNIGNIKAVSWIASALGLFDDEVKSAAKMWGDLGEGLYQMYEGENNHSDITFGEFYSLLLLDCSSISNSSYETFASALRQMSALELKWFVRYWLRKPRNGVNNKIPLKALALHYRSNDTTIYKYAQYNSASDICSSLELGQTPECRLSHGQFVQPMLAKARKGKERPDNYYVDAKYDGNRYQIHKSQDLSVIIFNRKGKIVTEQFPDVEDQMLELEVDDFIIDTEIYPINIDGTPAPHKKMGKRVHKLDKEEAVRECPVKMVAFDILYWKNVSFLDLNFKDRLERLSWLLPKDLIAKGFDNQTIEGAYNTAISLGFEGIMIKDLDMVYQAGKRSNAWLKYKPARISLDVVITSATYGTGDRSDVFGSFGISLRNIAYHKAPRKNMPESIPHGGDKILVNMTGIKGEEYVSIGSVGTGLSRLDLLNLTTDLKKNVSSYEKGVFTFLPRIVLEVTADLVTQDADGNYGLRFPRVVRIRDDKFAKDIDTLQNAQRMIL